MLDSVVIGGYRTVVATRRQLAEQMVADCRAARDRESPPPPKLVFSSNGQGIALGASDPKFQAVMDSADIIHADGMPVVLASRLLTPKPLPERIATTDFFHDAAEAAIDAGLSFYMLGASEDENARACDRILELYPQLRIAGRRNGYFKPEDEAGICQAIVDSGADVLWVALGKPLQEHWCLRNRERLAGVAWIKTCGGLYGFLSGSARRAPGWMQKLGLEWFHRMAEDPRRLLWRYLSTNPRAVLRMIRHSGDGAASRARIERLEHSK